MRRTRSAIARTDRGASAVEFALISVAFLTLCFGMIQYSIYFWSAQSAANAAREGARRGAVGQTCTELTAATKASIKMRDKNPTQALNVTRRYYAASDSTFSTPVTAATGTNVRVVITYESVNLHIPLIPFIKNGAVKETAVARVEYVDPATTATAKSSAC